MDKKNKIQQKILLSANIANFLLHFENGLLRTLIKMGYSVHCVSRYDADIFTKLEELGCICHSVHINRKGMNPIEDAYTLMQYTRLLRKIRPDALLNFTIKPVIYASIASRLLGIPTINTITGLGTVFISGGIKEKIVKNLYKISQKKVKKIFVLNREDKEVFKNAKLCTTSILSTVPGAGVNLEKFKYSPIPANKIDSTKIFLFIGRLLKDKGIVEYINAANIVNKKDSEKNSKAIFQILGPIDSENLSAISKNELNQYLKENSKLQYLGETSDVRNYIKNASCVVLPSYREGVPTVLLEALAIGRPIITTDAPGCNVVVEDGVNGYMVKTQDSNALAQAIGEVTSATINKLNQMGKAGREKVVKEFDEEIVIKKYLEAVTNL